MAQANRKRNVEPRRKAEAAAPSVQRPDWVVSGLAAAGMVVAAYLTWLKMSGGGAALCVAGSGCDIVQASRYATFLWVPTALWGLAVYVAIGALAWIGLGGRNWLIAFVLAAGGVGFSLYLTWLSIVSLGRDLCVVSDVGRDHDRNPRAARGAASRAEWPEVDGASRSPGHLWSSGGARGRGCRRVRVRRAVFRSGRIPGRARAAPRREQSRDVWSLLVTRLPRAKGPVRARGAGYPLRGV